jgi:hypothetical protein
LTGSYVLVASSCKKLVRPRTKDFLSLSLNMFIPVSISDYHKFASIQDNLYKKNMCLDTMGYCSDHQHRISWSVSSKTHGQTLSFFGQKISNLLHKINCSKFPFKCSLILLFPTTFCCKFLDLVEVEKYMYTYVHL